MATAQTLVDRALRLLGATESGESPTAQESADCLIALNAMLESWQTERLLVYAYVDTAFTLANGDSSYTVGPAGNFNLTPRPSKLENCFVRANSIDFPVEVVDQQRWFGIADKTVESDIPSMAYYEPAATTGILLLWPVPNAAHSLHIVTWTPLTAFASLVTTVALPPGYERALAYNLTVEVAPEYEMTPADSVVTIARETLAMLKRANQRPMRAYTELGGLINGYKSDIYSGGVL